MAAVQLTTCTWPRRVSRLRRLRTASLPTTQSRERVCSIAASTTMTCSPESASVTLASISWPTTSVSFGRWSNRAQADRAGGQRERARIDGGDPQHRHEDPPPGGQLDDQAEHPRRVGVHPQRHDEVAHLADALTIGPDDGSPAIGATKSRSPPMGQSLLRRAGAHPSAMSRGLAWVRNQSRRVPSCGTACQHHRQARTQDKPTSMRSAARDVPAPPPPFVSRRAGIQPEVHRQGPHAQPRPGLPRPGGRLRAAGQAGRPQDDRRGAQRGRLGEQDPRRAGQRLDHRVDLPRRHRGRGGRRGQPRRDHAAEGADRGPGRGPRHAAHADREGHGLRGRQDRDRGPDRERQGPDQRRRDRHRVPARRDDHLRPGRLHGVDQHEVAGGGGAAARVRRRRRLPPHPHVRS